MNKTIDKIVMKVGHCLRSRRSDVDVNVDVNVRKLLLIQKLKRVDELFESESYST